MRHKPTIQVTIFLIVLTLLVITVFQVYWLRKNYRQETRLLRARTVELFRETIFRLQVSKLNIDSNIKIRIQDREGVIGMSEVLQEEIQHIFPPGHGRRQTMVLMRGPGPPHRNSINVPPAPPVRRERVSDFLAGIDSLRDPINAGEIVDRYRKALEREKIDVPFTLNVLSPATAAKEFDGFPGNFQSNIVTVGFTKPVRYQALFNNNTWYLLKRISQPILISVFLLCITSASFLLLYRNLKQQQKLAEFKNDFISNITHELKTPIATVSVAIEALRGFNALEDPQRTNEYLDISANEMQRLSLLVDKVLKLSMFENRQITLNKEPFDMADLAWSMLQSMRLQFENKRASTNLKRTGRNFTITADKLHMTSVLSNLLDNALKYSRKTPEILIHIIDHTTYLEIRVSDNGMGIAKEYKNKIFEKFFRVPNGNHHNTKGYGLGLSYVAHIVQRHMGIIEVESEENKGSTFSIKLPFVEAPVVYYDGGRRIGNAKTGLT